MLQLRPDALRARDAAAEVVRERHQLLLKPVLAEQAAGTAAALEPVLAEQAAGTAAVLEPVLAERAAGTAAVLESVLAEQVLAVQQEPVQDSNPVCAALGIRCHRFPKLYKNHCEGDYHSP
jgi:hypothetical protein